MTRRDALRALRALEKADSIMRSIPGISPSDVDAMSDRLSIKCDTAVRIAVAVFRLRHPEPERLPRLPLYYPGMPAYDAARAIIAQEGGE